MDPVKDAFNRAKQDIDQLRQDFYSIYQELQEVKRTLEYTTDLLKDQTNRQQSPTNENIPTQDWALEGLKTSISDISTGNRGVPTDKQTDKQTDRHGQMYSNLASKADINSTIDRLGQISNALSTLDSVKKDLRIQFKRLTNQEMLVFATIYQLNEENNDASYPSLALKLHLSETSIRDYVFKIIKKGIPIVKEKKDNKKVTLKIPSQLTSLASLQTILTLREL